MDVKENMSFGLFDNHATNSINFDITGLRNKFRVGFFTSIALTGPPDFFLILLILQKVKKKTKFCSWMFYQSP